MIAACSLLMLMVPVIEEMDVDEVECNFVKHPVVLPDTCPGGMQGH